RRDFPRGTDDDVIQRLTALSPDDSSERLQAALVLGAAGKWNRFEQQLRRLIRDWRGGLLGGGPADGGWPARLGAAPPGPPGPPRPDAALPEAAVRPDRPVGGAPPPRPPRRDLSAPRRTAVRKQPRSPR